MFFKLLLPINLAFVKLIPISILFIPIIFLLFKLFIILNKNIFNRNGIYN
ncbi:MAG: hypothetical protein ACRDAQ_03250 [Cetobacterium sp.]